ncbi:MAG: MFS transporter [Polyangiaceae bacterium]|nr:MFS transporter [Polyangiaceae bacterium]
MNAYLSLLVRRPEFRRLWGAELVSLVGDWFSIVAVSVLSLGAPGGGVMALATSLAAHLLPQSLASPLGGFVADRFDKRLVLMLGSGIEAILTLGMVGAAASSNVVLLQVLLALRSIASAAREPASAAALPRLVEKHELADANALSAFTWSVAFAVGMSLGGLATAFGPEFALFIDGLTFVTAVLILRGIASLPPSARLSNRQNGLAESIDIALGAVRGPMRRSVFGLTPIALASGAAWLYLNLAGHAFPLVAGAATTVGLLQAIRGAGTALGPLVARKLDQAQARGDLGLLAAATVLVGTLALAWSPSLAVATVGATMWGAGGGALWVIVTTEIQTQADDGSRGRLIALSGLGFTMTMSAGALLTAAASAAGIGDLTAALPIVVLSGVGFVFVRRRREPVAMAAPEPALER